MEHTEEKFISVNEVFLLVGFTIPVVSYRGKNTPQGAINILVVMKWEMFRF